MIKSYRVEVDCANCALKMEQAISKLEGVKNASISFIAQKLTVEFDNVSEPELKAKMLKAVKKVDSETEIY